MENAVEALKMAGSILIFVTALSVAVLAFTQTREAVDSVLKYSDREFLTIENDERFYYLANKSDSARYVGKETIIPTIYRAYKENFKIIFKFPNDDYYLFQNTKGDSINKIDLASQNLGNDLRSRQFLNGIIYGNYAYEENKLLDDYKLLFQITPNNKPLYEYLTDMETIYKIKEELGTYYIEDLNNTEDETITKSEVKDVNKSEKRVITYSFINK